MYIIFIISYWWYKTHTKNKTQNTIWKKQYRYDIYWLDVSGSCYQMEKNKLDIKSFLNDALIEVRSLQRQKAQEHALGQVAIIFGGTTVQRFAGS